METGTTPSGLSARWGRLQCSRLVDAFTLVQFVIRQYRAEIFGKESQYSYTPGGSVLYASGTCQKTVDVSPVKYLSLQLLRSDE